METENNTSKDDASQVDIIWLVSNIFAIVNYLDDRFGPDAVEYIVQVATTIESQMREESAEEK